MANSMGFIVKKFPLLLCDIILSELRPGNLLRLYQLLTR
jgi:hypothetical protein